MEDIRKEKEIETRMRQKKTEERIQKALNRGDDYQEEKLNELLKKQEMAENIRKKFAEEKIKRAKELEIARKEKEKEILKILKKNDEIIQKRIDDYNKKQAELMERQKIQEKENKKKMEEKHLALCEKERKCVEARLRNEKLIEKNREEILKRINSNQEKILKQKELNNRETQERFIESSIKKEDIEDNLRMKERAKEFERLKKMAEIEERNKRVETIKLQKLKLYEERRRMNRSLEKDKENLLLKFNEIMSQRGGKSKEDIMTKLFNEDTSNSTKFKTIKTNKSSIDAFKTASNTNNNSKSMKTLNNKIVEENNDNDYNDFQKDYNFFVTNIKSP